MSKRINAFPKLETWFEENKNRDNSKNYFMHSLMLQLCKALSSESDHSFLTNYFEVLKKFCSLSPDPTNDYRDFEKALLNLDVSFVNIANETLKCAIDENCPTLYLGYMVTFADQTKHDVFHFLAAWSALNCNQFQTCIDQCERIPEPTAAVYTLQGQAYLESGNIEEAIDTLQISVSLLPSDILAHFQLAKAYHIAKKMDKAWEAISACEEIEPNHPEIAAMFAIIALSERSNTAWNKHAWKALCQSLASQDDNESLVSMMLDLAFLLKEKTYIDFILDKANWKQLQSDFNFIKKVPWILKNFDVLKWHDSAARLLTKVAAEAIA
jgi:tetratricopeptide (TPR) repeat protein